MPFSSDAQPNPGIIVAGTVPLTKDLNQNALVGNYNTANNTGVEAYLMDNLHWRVAKVREANLPSLPRTIIRWRDEV